MKAQCAPEMDGDEPQPVTPKQVTLKLTLMAVRKQVTYDQLHDILPDAMYDPVILDSIFEELEKRGISLVEEVI